MKNFPQTTKGLKAWSAPTICVARASAAKNGMTNAVQDGSINLGSAGQLNTFS